MLYCDQALPLGDVQLWQLAAGTLVKACEAVFSVIFRNCVNDPNMLEVLPGWLKAARLSFEWCGWHSTFPGVMVRFSFGFLEIQAGHG